MVEAVVGITLVGIGVASTLGALTKFNSIAAMSRNSTGVCAAVMNQIDLIQSDGPFNPQKANQNTAPCGGGNSAAVPDSHRLLQ